MPAVELSGQRRRGKSGDQQPADLTSFGIAEPEHTVVNGHAMNFVGRFDPDDVKDAAGLMIQKADGAGGSGPQQAGSEAGKDPGGPGRGHGNVSCSRHGRYEAGRGPMQEDTCP